VEGILLGIQKDARFDQVELRMNAGDVVVFYTDGITEAMDQDKRLFDFHRLRARFAEPQPMICPGCDH
jgi:sigma-B regulation protein RsbU (phosphoserine phosphatase)